MAIILFHDARVGGSRLESVGLTALPVGWRERGGPLRTGPGPRGGTLSRRRPWVRPSSPEAEGKSRAQWAHEPPGSSDLPLPRTASLCLLPSPGKSRAVTPAPPQHSPGFHPHRSVFVLGFPSLPSARTACHHAGQVEFNYVHSRPASALGVSTEGESKSTDTPQYLGLKGSVFLGQLVTSFLNWNEGLGISYQDNDSRGNADRILLRDMRQVKCLNKGHLTDPCASREARGREPPLTSRSPTPKKGLYLTSPA